MLKQWKQKDKERINAEKRPQRRTESEPIQSRRTQHRNGSKIRPFPCFYLL